ncbi:hypothetical protein [Aquimarina muelleri]|uniref:Lipoprotein n=1 Tax=Aquimarina muelleri TaxID=279356 RepID=A0A918JTR2_9FLAO|nr:hypothetical protein [Aquimarina muelleri]MCX2764218.1 hypothetical protein [Aquimarina muelleri]GGX08316.1 hypothetical protein GCM10007384_07830 [Aquimarina muelleri]
MKKLRFLPIFVIAATIFSCSSDDDAPTTPPTGGPTLDGIIATQDDDDLIVADLKGNVTGNITLAASEDWVLTGPLTVKSGSTLTIEAGTTIKAKAGVTDVYLAVEQGAKIEAEGTASAPIKFTSNASNPRPGDWGGIVIAGKTPTNKGATAESEVAGLNYGGTDATDNSGTLTYVIAEYTGAKINGDQEFNGISLYTVGTGTTINNIAVFNGADDGIEFFGGTVSVENILCVNIKDDMFDFTEGYNGTLTNLFGVRESDFNDGTEDPRGIEGDSNGSNNAATPVSKPTFEKVTVLNLSKITALKAGAEIRRGTEAVINNLFFGTLNGASFGNRIDTKDDKGNGTITITNAVYQGVVGVDNLGGTITGTFTEDTAAITVGADDVVTVKAGVGADFSKFAWTNYTVKK